MKSYTNMPAVKEQNSSERTTTLPLASVMLIRRSDIASEFAEEIAEFGEKCPQLESPARSVKGRIAERIHAEELI